MLVDARAAISPHTRHSPPKLARAQRSADFFRAGGAAFREGLQRDFRILKPASFELASFSDAKLLGVAILALRAVAALETGVPKRAEQHKV